MPYIAKEKRAFWFDGLDIIMDKLADNAPVSAGVINYLITELILFYIKTIGEDYEAYNTAIGILECVKQELYRRAVAPYEDKKIQENGDIY